MLLLGDKETELPTALNDPFQKDKWNRIFLYIWNADKFNEKIRYQADVKFQNGNTKGEQSFNADDFKDLINQVEAFMKSL
jgi:hypothetical protein